MAYKKIVKDVKEYESESYADSLFKKNGATWSPNEVMTYELVNTTGTIISSGTLEVSTNLKSQTFLIPSTDTNGLLGKHKILVNLGNVGDPAVSDVIAEYNIEFMARKA